MSKYSVFVPVDGKREELVASFIRPNVRYFGAQPEDFVTQRTAAKDATDEVIISIGEEIAPRFLSEGHVISECDGAYRVYSESTGDNWSEVIGWEVEVRVDEWQPYWNASEYTDNMESLLD